MTTEQIIVLGVLVAAFVAGWGVRALTGGQPRERPQAPRAEPLDPQLDRAVEATRLELDRAVRNYLATLAASLGAGATQAMAAQELRPEPEPAGQFRVERGEDLRERKLVEGVSAALQSDVAVERMLSVLPPDRRAGLDDRELDIADWGFAYGVAWGLARARRPDAPDEEIAREAQEAAWAVFREYAGEAVAEGGWAADEVAGSELRAR